MCCNSVRYCKWQSVDIKDFRKIDELMFEKGSYKVCSSPFPIQENGSRRLHAYVRDARIFRRRNGRSGHAMEKKRGRRAVCLRKRCAMAGRKLISPGAMEGQAGGGSRRGGGTPAQLSGWLHRECAGAVNAHTRSSLKQCSCSCKRDATPPAAVSVSLLQVDSQVYELTPRNFQQTYRESGKTVKYTYITAWL